MDILERLAQFRGDPADVKAAIDVITDMRKVNGIMDGYMEQMDAALEAQRTLLAQWLSITAINGDTRKLAATTRAVLSAKESNNGK